MTVSATPPTAPPAGDRPAGPVTPPTPPDVTATPPAVVPPRPARGAEIPAVRITGVVLTLLGVLLLGFVVHLTLISEIRYDRSQQVAYADFRKDLAEAVAPVGQSGFDNQILRLGAPVAVLRIPALGTQQVVFEGTTAGVLADGPGHRRDTPLPGQAGTSMIMGRRAAYGGPFKGLPLLRAGDQVMVVTGQGEHEYRVIGVRHGGEPQPPRLASGAGRLVLATAAGRPYLPTDVVYVDADLVSEAQPAPKRRIGPGSLTRAEKTMAGDPTAWTALLLWGQALLIAAYAVSWAWARWGGWQAWVVGAPLLSALGLAVADQVARVLPNLY
ncbi:class E sortase [Micromonospora sp. NPDC049523]|uniref:sortase n=1 Tax=Micromonospora sp. NPDC049523 TaxID=3155921 RepID=UPI003421E561